jgi:hypothetical protein
MTRLVDRIEAAREIREEIREDYAFQGLCESLRVSKLQVPCGQVVFAGYRRGDVYEADGYIYNGGKRSRRWCIDPRLNISGQRMLTWPSRFADLAAVQRLSLRLGKMVVDQSLVITKLLRKYNAAGITAVSYRKEGTPPKDGSLRYEIRRNGKELSYSTDRTPPIASLVDATVAYAHQAEGAELHRAVQRNSTLWKRVHRVERVLDLAIRHHIGRPTAEKVYLFEICGVPHVYSAERDRELGYFELKRVSAGIAVDRLVIE